MLGRDGRCWPWFFFRVNSGHRLLMVMKCLLGSPGDTARGMDTKPLRRIQWLAVVLPALAVGLYEFLRHQWPGPLFPGWFGAGWAGNALATLVVAGVVYAFVRAFASMLQASALEVARAREQATVAMERQRIAREMHDGVAQALFYLRITLRNVSSLVAAGETGKALSELRTVEEHVEDVRGRVRTTVADLNRQAELVYFDDAVRHTVSRTAKRLGLQAVCEAEGSSLLPASTQKHLLAIIQEALTNAHRHGRPRRVRVSVRTHGRDLTIEVADDGVGFDPDAVPQEGHFGLMIMSERARMVGGELRVNSVPGRGTRVMVRIPEVDG